MRQYYYRELVVGLYFIALAFATITLASIITLPDRCTEVIHDRNGEVSQPRTCQ